MRPLGPEQDLKLLFFCTPQDPLRISVQIRLDYVHFFTALVGYGLALALSSGPPHRIPPLLFSNLPIYKTNTLPACQGAMARFARP